MTTQDPPRKCPLTHTHPPGCPNRHSDGMVVPCPPTDATVDLNRKLRSDTAPPQMGGAEPPQSLAGGFLFLRYGPLFMLPLPPYSPPPTPSWLSYSSPSLESGALLALLTPSPLTSKQKSKADCLVQSGQGS